LLASIRNLHGGSGGVEAKATVPRPSVPTSAPPPPPPSAESAAAVDRLGALAFAARGGALASALAGSDASRRNLRDISVVSRRNLSKPAGRKGKK
jgi:hypothetical protein